MISLPTLPTRDEFIFSLKCFAAAMLALYLAFKIGLPRPFWSPLTAYVVSQPFAGSTRSKAIYRVCGTTIGGLGIVMLIPTFINYTFMFALAIGCWFGVCLFISLNDRTPRSYAFLLGGYTLGFVAMPAISSVDSFSVESIFDLAVARVEEICLGAFCSTFIHSLVLPRDIGAALMGRLDELMRDAQLWISNLLSNQKKDGKESPLNTSKLAQVITELRIISTHLPYDSSNVRWATNIVRSLEDRFSSLVPILSAIEDRLQNLSDFYQKEKLAEYRKLVSDISDWVMRGAEHSTPIEAIRLRRRIDRLTPAVYGELKWEDMLLASLSAELYRLIDASEHCFELRKKINTGLTGKLPDTEMKERNVSTFTLYVDRRLALSSAFATGMSMFGTLTLWAVSGWPAGFAAPMMAGMYCMFFSTFDNPVPVLKEQCFFTICSTPVSGLYLLWLLPSAHSFEMLMLMMAPLLIWFGRYLYKPNTALKVIPFLFTVMASLVSFDMGSANATSFINSQISQAMGVFSAALFTAVFRIATVDALIRRLVDSIWHDISSIGRAAKAPSVMGVAVKVVDGVFLLTPRLALATKTVHANNPKVIAAGKILSDIRVGINMTHLLRHETRLSRYGIDIRPVLTKISEYYQMEKRWKDKPLDEMRFEIDRTLFRLAENGDREHLTQEIAVLAGIRRDLFPDAAPYSASVVRSRASC